MKNAIIRFTSFFMSKKGQGMVEYGLIIALVAIVIIAALVVLGGNVKDIFTNTASELTKSR